MFAPKEPDFIASGQCQISLFCTSKSIGQRFCQHVNESKFESAPNLIGEKMSYIIRSENIKQNKINYFNSYSILYIGYLV